MRFEEIIPLLRKGKKIRRKDWDKEDYAYIKDGYIVFNGFEYGVIWKYLFDNKWELYEESILDKEEKEYLKAVIKPFKIKCIAKNEITSGLYEFITICLDNEMCELITLPYFKKGTMYKNMDIDKRYTLKELGL